MTDYFSLFNEPRRPWLDAEKLKARFLTLSAECHPDRAVTAAEREAATARFTELNAAHNCLREPRERLQHLLALEGAACISLGAQTPLPDIVRAAVAHRVDVVALSFICEPKRKTIDIVTTVLPGNVKGERPGRIKLSGTAASLEFAGKTSRYDEDRGIHFSASTAIDARLFDLLDRGSSLRIEAMGARDSVPLAQIKKPLAQMRQACR